LRRLQGSDKVDVSFEEAVKLAGQLVDAVGVAIVLVGAIFALIPYSLLLVVRRATNQDYREVRKRLGRSILLGLEFLVAADIIRTVAISPTIGSVAALGMIVLIRTFLSMALQVEIEGRWPWQREETPSDEAVVKPRSAPGT
jgi:uncharacterized membrane protein